MTFIPSPGVRRMLGLRMDESVGKPTFFQKIGALFGADGKYNASVLAGDEHDLSQGEQDLAQLFSPIISLAENEGLADLRAAVTTVLTGATSVTSVAGAVALVKSAVAVAGGAAASQAESLGETALTTLVSAILSSLGKTTLPAA